jgi:hypothetical protein
VEHSGGRLHSAWLRQRHEFGRAARLADDEPGFNDAHIDRDDDVTADGSDDSQFDGSAIVLRTGNAEHDC